MTRSLQAIASATSIAIQVVEPRAAVRRKYIPCEIDENVQFSIDSLESYFFARWDPVAYDALLVAAAVEFGDRIQRRPSYTWKRHLTLRIPVHEPDRWNHPSVMATLLDVLDFLTGDDWHIEFYRRSRSATQPEQGRLSLQSEAEAVLPFSNGLDSRAVAALMGRRTGDKLILVRLGPKPLDGEVPTRQPFTSVPFRVRSNKPPFVESTVRSRGFKFALISALAAYLSSAHEVVVPESGQGALGPALVPVGQTYEDYRSHPLFTERMQRFVNCLLGCSVRFVFPRLWYTKAETLKTFIDECQGDSSWSLTWSCWQQNRQVSVDHKKRQCGVCAACILRRLSIHAARLSEANERYVWEDLSAPTFSEGAAKSFPRQKITRAMREYAIAGVLHLDHLAALLDSPANTSRIDLSSFQLSQALGLGAADVRARLERLLRQHSKEWTEFLLSLGPRSFVCDWAQGAR